MVTKIMLEFVEAEHFKPDVKEDEFYGKRYSVPVIVANAVTGQIFDQIVQYDFHKHGWVYYGLPDGPDPYAYEICHVTHFATFPMNFNFEA